MKHKIAGFGSWGRVSGTLSRHSSAIRACYKLVECSSIDTFFFTLDKNRAHVHGSGMSPIILVLEEYTQKTLADNPSWLVIDYIICLEDSRVETEYALLLTIFFEKKMTVWTCWLSLFQNNLKRDATRCFGKVTEQKGRVKDVRFPSSKDTLEELVVEREVTLATRWSA